MAACLAPGGLCGFLGKEAGQEWKQTSRISIFYTVMIHLGKLGKRRSTAK